MGPLAVFGLVAAGVAGVGVVAAVSSDSGVIPRPNPHDVTPHTLGGAFLKRVDPPPAGFTLAPSGVPFVWSNTDFAPGAGHEAMDASAQRWISQWVSDPAPPGYRLCEAWEMKPLHGTPDPRCWPKGAPGLGQGRWEWTQGGGGEGWQAIAFDVAQKVWDVALTVAATYATSAIGGVGGVAVASLIDVVNGLAQGASLTDAVVAEAAKQAKDQFQKSKFYDTYRAAASIYASAKGSAREIADQVEKLRAEQIKSSKEDASTMVDSAIGIAQAQKIQALSTAQFKTHLRTVEEKRWLDECLAAGAELKHWAYALYGDVGYDLAISLVEAQTRALVST